MKSILVTVLVVMATMGAKSSGQIDHENGIDLVLPNSQLLLCKSSTCSQLWEDKPAKVDAIYPRQLIVDIFGDGKCPRGIMALYEKSVSIDQLKASIDSRYGKWALADNATSRVKLWRVESEKFAIQLAVTGSRDVSLTKDQARADAIGRGFGYGDRSDVTEAGMKQVIYIAFTGTKCGGQ
jgi:hypothetical protein